MNERNIVLQLEVSGLTEGDKTLLLSINNHFKAIKIQSLILKG